MFDLNKLEKKFKERTPEPAGTLSRFAVLALMTEIDGRLHFVMEKRASDMNRQPGEICFPGGRIEKGETHLETALRETEEELGIPHELVKILGEPDFVVTFYDTVIYPFAGFVDKDILKNLKLSSHEVEKVIIVSAEFFKKPLTVNKILMHMTVPDDFPFELIPNGKDYKWGKPIDYIEYFYKYEDDIIWGLTARIAQNIVDILGV